MMALFNVCQRAVDPRFASGKDQQTLSALAIEGGKTLLRQLIDPEAQDPGATSRRHTGAFSRSMIIRTPIKMLHNRLTHKEKLSVAMLLQMQRSDVVKYCPFCFC